MELESHAMQIACAHGIVGVGGLGMGMALFNIMRKPNVTKVFVIEKEASIVQLFRDVTDFDNWVGREKVTIIRRDLLRTEFPTDLDYLYIDIWPNIGDNDVEGDVIKIGKSLKPKEISWWTMEMTFIDWMRKKKIPYHDKSTALIAQWREEFSIPISVGNPDEFLRSLDGVAANVVSGGFT